MRMGNRIHVARRARNWTKGQLAQRAGVAPSYITRIERGEFDRPSIDKIRAIAGALGVGVLDLADPPRPPVPEDVLEAAARIAERNPVLAKAVLEEIASRSPEEQAGALRTIEAVLSLSKGGVPPHMGHPDERNDPVGLRA